MDFTHLHLLLNHFPIIGTLVGIGIMAWGLIKKEYNIQQAVLGLWVVLTLLTFPVMKTGEDAEETVEKIPGVAASMISAHEEAAETAVWLMGALGLLSLAGLLLARRNEYGKKIPVYAFLLSLVVFGAMARTGYLGGQIRHTELAGAAATQSGSTAASPAPAEDRETGDDD